jgi:hypothetical protein
LSGLAAQQSQLIATTVMISYTCDHANRLIGVSGAGVSVNYSYNGQETV